MVVTGRAMIAAALFVACSGDDDDGAVAATATPAGAIAAATANAAATETATAVVETATATVAATATETSTPAPAQVSNGWRVPRDLDIGTLESAWQVGLNPGLTPYVEATVSEVTSRAYFVFTAERDEIQLVLSPFAGEAPVERVECYASDGGALGEIQEPVRRDPTGGTWLLEPGTTYVVEVFGTAGALC